MREATYSPPPLCCGLASFIKNNVDEVQGGPSLIVHCTLSTAYLPRDYYVSYMILSSNNYNYLNVENRKYNYNYLNVFLHK